MLRWTPCVKLGLNSDNVWSVLMAENENKIKIRNYPTVSTICIYYYFWIFINSNLSRYKISTSLSVVVKKLVQ